ncbi:MAG: serine--tRNA ligase [Phycisphaerae bacterium]|nr:serine--tRNA ligase [Phycisphaerae bacterium]MCZ2400568.1 serine--tRNA ligase [Phycisphaerae bacterium]NUQ49693.1 serine--tRNA ligase [Phycisphaerae bacterium]
MIDIRLIRENPELVRQAAADKGMKVDVDRVLEVDARRRAIETEFNELRSQQNRTGERIAKAPKEEKAALSAEMGKLKARLRELDEQRAGVEAELHQLMLLMPQIPAPEAPRGRDPRDNVEVRRVGEPKRREDFGFPFRDHLELGEKLGIIDMERGVKLAGSRNYVLRGAGAMLHEAVLRLAWDLMVGRRFERPVPRDQGAKGSRHDDAPAPSLSFEPLTVPVLVLDKLMEGTGFFPLHRDEVYLAERDGQCLVGTAEVPVTGFHGDEVLALDELPKLYFARSTCFRREAGAAGKDTRGLYRIHFFDKLEQVVICAADDAESAYWHEVIIRNATDVLDALELPYRLLEVCTGDMGQGKVRMFDIETWMPSRDAYGETHSASRFGEFQARRLNLRYRDADGRLRFCHTLNNTVIASPRILIPILEMNQNADGSVTVPQALRAYMGGLERVS